MFLQQATYIRSCTLYIIGQRSCPGQSDLRSLARFSVFSVTWYQEQHHTISKKRSSLAMQDCPDHVVWSWSDHFSSKNITWETIYMLHVSSFLAILSWIANINITLMYGQVMGKMMRHLPIQLSTVCLILTCINGWSIACLRGNLKNMTITT